MRKLKSVLSLALILGLCLSLAACALSEDDVVGVWTCSYVYNGNDLDVAFALDEDGTYAEVINRNGVLSSTEVGTWEIDGRRVLLHPDGEPGTTPFNYKGGKLENNDHYFTRE